jgi:CNT family concentrative nucleoside transporter
MERIIAIMGILVIIGTAVLFSEGGTANGTKPRFFRRLRDNFFSVSWKLVGIGLVLNFIMAAVMLKVPGTSDAVISLGKGINNVIDFAMQGAVFVLGDTLVYGKFFKPGQEVAQQEFIFAIRIFFSIIFVSGLVAIGYYLGVLQRLVKLLARFLVKSMGLSGPEALSCASAAWVGQVECQLLIKPYMPTLTRSELFTTMTAAMATTAGSALVAYVSIGMPANYLITASLMSALNGIILAKIICPEKEPEKLLREAEISLPSEGANIFDAAAHGVTAGTDIAVKVVTMVAFAIGIMAMLNCGFEKVLGLVGIHASIQDALALPFMPVAWLIGVPWHECFHVGRLMATELIFNEMVSFGELAPVIHGAGTFVLAAKTQLIASVALCGFAHLGSLGINIGGLGSMAPNRKAEIAGMAFKAMMVANMATWLSAAVCGLLF